MSDLPRVTDAMYAEIELLLGTYDPHPRLGRRRAPLRLILEALAYRLETGCSWTALPVRFGDDSTAHRTVQRWQRLGIYDEIVAILTGREGAR